jgi:6-pyruvoyltetrahydropterin/6-carboxytetrahydropterin synthase
MYTLTKRATFEASHQLPHHDGKCARLHGHSWQVVVEVQGDKLQETGPQAGMLVDFYRIGDPLKRLVEKSLDHYHLNDSTGLENPTSEALARWIYDRLALEVPLLSAVVGEETCTARAEYRP